MSEVAALVLEDLIPFVVFLLGWASSGNVVVLGRGWWPVLLVDIKPSFFVLPSTLFVVALFECTSEGEQ